jgi:hypothetical protein
VEGPVSAAPPTTPVTWTAHPARRRPDHVALSAAVILLSTWAVLVTLEAPGLAALAAVLLIAALAPFLFPTHYRIDAVGVEARRLGRRQARPWTEIRRVDVGARAALVSPFARPRWLDRYRGLIVLFDGGDRAAIVAALTARGEAAA